MGIVMYDDINLLLIPKDAPAVAGYVNGRWPTYAAVVKRWPRAKHLSIAVTPNADADCIDVEPGDATNAVAAGWIKRQMARGVRRPVVYTQVSNAAALIKVLANAGIMRSQIRLWTAHYTDKSHLCGPSCGFGLKTVADATQWTSRALGRSLDESICANDFFSAPPKPKPLPKPPPLPPPKPLPAPKPKPMGPHIYLRSKDGSEHWEPFSRKNIIYRSAQLLRGKFAEVRFVRKP